MKHLLHIFITVVCIAVVAGCADNSRLRDDIDRAGRLADTCPDSAIALLDSLSPAINQADRATRMRYDLMLIKSRDKAYIEHRNDSMIAPVVEYFTGHSDPDLTPLALYYAGRVYSDLGDAPRALDYFQQALTTIGDDTIKHYGIYKVCHSQMAELFMHQRLYRYALESAEKAVDLTSKSTLPIDYITIGGVFSSLGVQDSIFPLYNKAYEMALAQNDINVISRVQRQIAWEYYDMGEIDKADSVLNRLKNVDKIIDYKDQYYGIWARVKVEKGDYKSSFPYIKWLVDSGNVYDKSYANAALANYYKEMPNEYDKSIKHFNRYILLLDSVNKLKQTDAIAKIQGYYNYSLIKDANHKLKEENSQKTMVIVILSSILFSIVIITLLIIRELKGKRTILSYRNIILKSLFKSTYIISIEYRNNLQKNVDELSEELSIVGNHKSELTLKLAKSKLKLKEIDISIEERAENHLRLMNSDIVIQLRNYLNNEKKRISSGMWDELSKAVDNSYPDFTHKLINICGINNNEYRISLLIKIEFLPSEIATLLCKSRVAISSTRKRLSENIFTVETSSPKDWDEFIRLL
nr:hypothetical protein [uncultured Muribaculum sp.]